jgi:PAS domain S-box-containing protein
MSVESENRQIDGVPFEEPLLRGEVAFRLLVEAVQDYAIFLIGPDGRVLTWNLGAQRIKGYTADEIIGQHFSVFYTAEDREAERPAMLLRTAADFGRFEDEGWRVRKDGTRFFADVVLTALRDDQGRPYAYAKVTRDMTERRAAEERARQLLGEQQARAAAEEALKARDRFLGIASHELKTPVASLQLATEALARAQEMGRLDEARLTTGLQRMGNATRRLASLVDELLDVSRLTSQNVRFEPVPTDMTSMTADVIARFSELGGSERVRLEADGPAWAVADVARLEQVVTNLVDNALKYSNAPSPVVVRIDEVDGGVVISVTDEGIGLDVPPDRMFEAFGRGPNAEHIPGMGLGLFIARQIVERHGGRISGSARPDTGTAFTVWLPSVPAEDSRDGV